MENKIIPTAEEFLMNKGLGAWFPNKEAILQEMIEFAKLHVEAALKAKAKAMIEKSYEDSSYSMNELDSCTRNAYPLENIK